ncbi:succinate dehydrogenase subunit C [Stackebrandtia albiflava]|uniref:Succinate dehydrogenase subunit C n=1 Tax=Stackebrandtia albiflava TaxID=406432 RepID=A0A562VDE0_9ACTN|nr:succinate dehydrogenase cytochrome b subunit [Stackebrandtia albiflava]TWJ15837.1 succinate dehydrogenase subunit C [Stackebrandtia albiflava]
MALDTRTKRPAKTSRAVPAALWRSTIGKKVIMSITGLIMIGYLVAHMAGNIKVFSGEEKFNSYAHWLRTFGEPVLPYEGFLWLMRVLLLVAVVAHIVSAVQLTRRAVKDRPRSRTGKPRGGGYVTFTMRSGGVILFLFIIWHILDLTTLTVNERAEVGNPYGNLVATFDTWYGNVIYIAALLALGYHLKHGIWAAAQTLGVGTTTRNRVFRPAAVLVALVITVGFVAVPIGVMTGVVS